MRHTSNQEDNSVRSLLGALRQVVPAGRLRVADALTIAEMQARQLLRLSDITAPAVPSSLIAEQPRFHVVYRHDMPTDTSGLTYWNGTHWLISINANEHPYRQRFSLFLEYKHVVDHTTLESLFDGLQPRTAGLLREQLADYFAGLVLMPKPWLKSAWCNGLSIAELSDLFQTSERAIEVRLHQLGLRDLTTADPQLPRRTIHRTYFRRSSAAVPLPELLGAAA